MSELRAQRWFDAVRDSCDDLEDSKERDTLIQTVLAAAEYYEAAYEDAKQHLMLVGRLETLLTEITGVAFFYNGIHTDALQVRQWLDMIGDQYEAKKYVWFQTTDDGKAMLGVKPTATDLRNHIKADEVVCLLQDCSRLIADRLHMMEDVLNGLVSKGFNLQHILNTRIHKLEEVWVDSTKETNNV